MNASTDIQRVELFSRIEEAVEEAVIRLNIDAPATSKKQLAERVFVKENEPMAALCQKQTAVYNQAIWYLRQEYFNLGDSWKTITSKDGKQKQVAAGFLTYYDLNDKSMLKWKPCYRDAIPLCAANTIQRACDAWKAYWAALKQHAKDPSGFTGKPKMPGYVDRFDKSPVYFTYIQFSIKDHHVHFPAATGFGPIRVLRLNDQKMGDSKAPVKQVRVIPAKHGGYWVEAVYNVDVAGRQVDKSRIMGIDIGLVRVVTIVDNVGGEPVAIPGGPAIEVNHWYNKELARLQAEQMRCDPRAKAIQQKFSTDETSLTDDEWREWKQRTKYTPKMKVLTDNRNNRINAFYHRVSKAVVDEAVKRGIGVIVIGHNPGQKQRTKEQHRMNDNARQKFTQQPVFKLIGMIKYKAELQSIEVVEVTEEFTSKASFIDGDVLPDRKNTKKKPNGHSDVSFSGNRVKRGVYKSKEGFRINADVNGAYNILRKALPNAFTGNGMAAEGDPAHEVRLHPRILDIKIHERGRCPKP